MPSLEQGPVRVEQRRKPTHFFQTDPYESSGSAETDKSSRLKRIFVKDASFFIVPSGVLFRSQRFLDVALRG
jgi:hypothetical protein